MADDSVDVLLVEDNPADVELTLHALHRNSLAQRIHIARDGEEALDYIFCRRAYDTRNFDHQPKLILLDLKLPKVDGLTVLARLKNDPRTKLIPVIILTSSKEDTDLVRSYQWGANSYIQKPVDFGQFCEAVKQLGLYWLLMNRPAPPSAVPAQPRDQSK
ncbi:MAG TPA: response regulator [Candidatus Acidoferrales bacterium]|nr:response regulator [Candidatus Acidoferrales bacterium]